MMDLIKIPRSVPVSRDLFPFKLTPRPAEPESFNGISKVSCSVVSRENAQQSGSPFCWKHTQKGWRRRKQMNVNIHILRWSNTCNLQDKMPGSLLNRCNPAPGGQRAVFSLCRSLHHMDGVDGIILRNNIWWWSTERIFGQGHLKHSKSIWIFSRIFSITREAGYYLGNLKY